LRFESLGGEGRDLGKRKEERKNEGMVAPQLEWGFIFLHNTKSPKYGELKSRTGGGFLRA
jgi:hypothetical protein